MFKLGTMVKDKVTGLNGMLTHLRVEGGAFVYLFQPHGLNPKTQEPVEVFFITPERITDGVESVQPTPLVEALAAIGTEVEDQASGFADIAVAAVLHINGCVHIDVQPAGIVAETGQKAARHNFDIRRLKGSAIKQMTDAEIEKSVAASPSPAAFPRLRS